MTPEDQTAPDEETAPETQGTEQQDIEVTEEERESVPVDTAPLERAEDAIDEAREAASKVAQTDSIDAEATGAGDLPAFADSTYDSATDSSTEDADDDDDASVEDDDDS